MSLEDTALFYARAGAAAYDAAIATYKVSVNAITGAAAGPASQVCEHMAVPHTWAVSTLSISTL
jgi:hypothetical protein